VDRCLRNKHLSKCFRWHFDGANGVVHWGGGILTTSIRQKSSIFVSHSFSHKKTTLPPTVQKKILRPTVHEKKSFHFFLLSKDVVKNLFYSSSYGWNPHSWSKFSESTCFLKNRNISIFRNVEVSYLPGPGRGMWVEVEEGIYDIGGVSPSGVRGVYTCRSHHGRSNDMSLEEFRLNLREWQVIEIYGRWGIFPI
jgi:hypothetical protein